MKTSTQQMNNTQKLRPDRNTCPTHGTRLTTAYYSDMDLLLVKCSEKRCTDGHAIVENYLEMKEKKKKEWLARQAGQPITELQNSGSTVVASSSSSSVA